MSAGKRGASGPIVTTSDEEESGVESPRTDREATFSPTFHDHDYDNVASPSSSTASGPIYVRQPGFSKHAHEVSRPRIKKKKVGLVSVKDGIRRREPTPPKLKPKREPLPMRMRALPQSFWQQPNVAHNVSPVTSNYVLPPLFNRDSDTAVSLCTDERPVTPVEDKTSDSEENNETTTQPHPPTTTATTTIPTVPIPPRNKPPRQMDRKLTVANTELLNKLFEGVEQKDRTGIPNTAIRRGRPRKFVPCSNKTLVTGEDPYLMDCMTAKLFPQLTLEQGKSGAGHTAHHMLQVVTLKEGDKSISLPSLSVEQNYPQMLSELVMHI